MTTASPSSQRTVLIVEDDERKGALVEQLARRASWRVVRTWDVKSALAALAQEQFQFVVSDWSLPDGTGLQVVRLAQKKSIPVVVYSGDDRQIEDVEWIESTNVDDLRTAFKEA